MHSLSSLHVILTQIFEGPLLSWSRLLTQMLSLVGLTLNGFTQFLWELVLIWRVLAALREVYKALRTSSCILKDLRLFAPRTSQGGNKMIVSPPPCNLALGPAQPRHRCNHDCHLQLKDAARSKLWHRAWDKVVLSPLLFVIAQS